MLTEGRAPSEEDLRCPIEFLEAENEMLRARVPKKRIFLSWESGTAANI